MPAAGESLNLLLARVYACWRESMPAAVESLCLPPPQSTCLSLPLSLLCLPLASPQQVPDSAGALIRLEHLKGSQNSLTSISEEAAAGWCVTKKIIDSAQ